MRPHEIYELVCSGCNRTIEIRAGDPDKPEVVRCPKCGAELPVEWRAGE